ncbi:glycosyltransferase family 2 protein, partial [Streptomyces sp. GbtcB7]|uniref:glycosyltransferase n=1 Tax=Streptomyces sp. GbtcB7 TaxID=2824752 RepID=UPI001C3097D3
MSSQVDAPDLEVIVAANNAKAFAELEALNRGSRSGTFSTVDATTSPGASHARNVGWRSAQGSVILFCDADDLVPSDWVCALAKSLADADVV